MTHEFKHTPGPWEVSAKNPAKVVNTKGGLIVQCNSRFWSETDEPDSDAAWANAALIAAAPELLEAIEKHLKAVEVVISGKKTAGNSGFSEACVMMLAAVAKAKGAR